jgi:hypothetical protein
VTRMIILNWTLNIGWCEQNVVSVQQRCSAGVPRCIPYPRTDHTWLVMVRISHDTNLRRGQTGPNMSGEITAADVFHSCLLDFRSLSQ